MNPQPTLIEEATSDSGSPTSRRGSLITEQLCEELAPDRVIFPKGQHGQSIRIRAAAKLSEQAAEIERLKSHLADEEAGGADVIAALEQSTARVEALEAALKRLSFAAQTSGGTAGRDDALQSAINNAASVLAMAVGHE